MLLADPSSVTGSDGGQLFFPKGSDPAEVTPLKATNHAVLLGFITPPFGLGLGLKAKRLQELELDDSEGVTAKLKKFSLEAFMA